MEQHLNEILEHADFGIPRFLEQWQEWGAGVQEEVFKFFCYYTAFNFLYNHWDGKCRNCNLNNPYQSCKYLLRDNDRKKIIFTEKCKICNTIRNIIEDATDFNPFLTSILKSDAEIIIRPVKAIQTQLMAPRVTYGECTLENIQNLFINIYHVRCNLYHGSKAMSGDRDKALVKESAAVLKYLLNYITEKYR